MENKKIRRYEFEGIVVDIPLVYDDKVNRYLEEYPDFVANPIYTSNGMPLMLCIEDVCIYAEPIDKDELVDCSDCIYFQRVSKDTLFGYCKCKNNIK